MRAPQDLTVVVASAGLPQLLYLQVRAIRAFLSPSARVLVVDDSRSRRHYSNQGTWNTPREIKRVCKLTGSEYRRVPQILHLARRRQFPATTHPWGAGPSLRTADSLQFAWSFLEISEESPLVVLDSDMLPIQPASASQYLAGSSVAFLPQTRTTPEGPVEYPWPGILVVDRRAVSDWKTMSWDCATVDGVALDTGGALSTWLKSHRGNARHVTGLHSNMWSWAADTPDIDNNLHTFLDLDAELNQGRQFCELFEGSLLHLRASSNWMKERRGTFKERIAAFFSGMESLLEARGF